MLRLMSKPRLIVFTGPSGVGKGTIVKKLFEDPNIQSRVIFSVSATTRAQRTGEQEGLNYFFKTRAEFEQMIQEDALLEWAEFVGNYYGSPKAFVEEALARGKSVFLEIEVQGALQIMSKYSDALTIFLMPPSFIELERRLRERATEPEDILQKRLAKAKEEMLEAENFDHRIVNDDIERAVQELKAAILGT